MKELPTADEFFGESKLPTADEFFTQEKPSGFAMAKNALGSIITSRSISNPAVDAFIQETPAGRIMHAFGSTATGALTSGGDLGIELGGETDTALRKAGIFNDYIEGENNFNKAMTEAFVRPAAMVLDATYRGTGAVLGGSGEAILQSAIEIDKKLPHPLQDILPEFTEYALVHKAEMPMQLARARGLGVIGENESTFFGTKEPTPEQALGRIQAEMNVSPRILEEQKDIHTIAREISPDIFEEYDALQLRRENLRTQLQEAALKRDEELKINIPYAEELQSINEKIKTVTDKVRGVESRLTKKQTALVEDLRKQHSDLPEEASRILEADTTDMATIRQEMLEADYKMRDLSPKVSVAYKIAEAEVPPPHDEMLEVEKAETPIEEKDISPANEPEIISNNENVKPVDQQLTNISSDISQKLLEAGRPLEEAEAAGQLIAEHYKSVSELGWTKGTAEEIYMRDAANIIGAKEHLPKKITELKQKSKGKIRLATDDAKAVITLFKNADASTFIHETGHAWLDEMMRYAKEIDAPETLLKDKLAVEKWLNIKEGEGITTRQHEKFARGFERYLLEGTAPSQKLAEVFAKFKQWLANIYQSVQKLNAPITDDIRDVFARLLSSTPEKVTITPEREIPPKTPEIVSSIKTEEPFPAKDITPSEEKEVPLNTPEPPVTPVENTIINNGTSSVAESALPAQAIREEEFKPKEKDIPPESPNTILGKSKSNFVDKAGNIRLDNLNTPEDIKEVIRQTAQENADFINARRGVVSDAQVLDLADALGMEASRLDRRKLGEAFNAEQIVAARKLLIQSATNVRDLAAKVGSGTEKELMEFAAARERHIMIQSQVSGITAEAGRALRAFRALEGSAEAKALTDILLESTGKDLYQLEKEAKLLTELDTTQKISKFINDSTKPTFKDMILEFWINALLSGTLTHVKNILGNTFVALNSVVETVIASGIGKITGSQAIPLPEAKARLFGFQQGAQEGLIAAAKVLKDENLITGAHTVEKYRVKAIPGVIGKIIRIPTRLLSAEDELFKAIGYRQELNTMAYRLATKEGLQGDAFNQRVAEIVINPSEEMMKAASKASAYQTFTNPLGQMGRSLQNFSNSHFLAKLILPFVRTPVNILKYAGERTPFGLLSKEVRDNLKGINGAEAKDIQSARLALGGLIVSTVAWQSLQGNITGGGPSDSAEKAMLRMTGWQPYSIKIGEMYYSYEWLDPFATVAGTTADITEAITKGSNDEEDINKVISSAIASISKNLVSKLSLRGISDFIQTFSDPDRYGQRYLSNLASSFIPSVSGQLATTVDPILRSSQTLSESLKAKIPGLKNTLFPRRDIWGNPIISQGNLGPDLLSPVRQSAFNKDPVNQMLVKLKIFPKTLDRKIRGVELTEQQYDDYSKLAGNMAKSRLDNYVHISGVNNVPPHIQVKTVTAIIEDSREKAKRIIMMNNQDIIKKAIDIKINAAQGIKKK